MKASTVVVCLLSVSVLGACDHYSQKLAAMDQMYKAQGETRQAYNEDGLNMIVTAAGGEAIQSGLSFNEALARDYYDLARYENDQMYDYTAAKYFTQKAAAAARGETVQPGSFREFGIPAASAAELEEARADLLAALHTRNLPQNAMILAAAQTKYDCWLDDREDSASAESVCRTQFLQVMEQLTPMVEQHFSAFFAPGSAALDPSAQAVVAEIAGIVNAGASGIHTIILSGQGESDLTTARMQTIGHALTSSGVHGTAILFDAKGTSLSPMEAADTAAARPEEIRIILQRPAGPDEQSL